MNRYDDRFSRGRRSEYERDEWRDRERQGRESSRESFYPGNYGFEEGEYSGRTAGGPDQQPFSRNPYGYYPGQRGPGQQGGQSRPDDDWRERDRGSRERYGWQQRFGQREPYNTRGDYSRSGPFQGGYDDDYARYRRGGSRYSESQYSTAPGRRESEGYGGGSYGSGDEPWRNEWRGGREGEERYERGRYRRLGEGPFADMTEEPGYFGTGYYGDGGAGPGGGYDQRTRSRNYGSLGEDMFSSDGDTQSWNRWTTGQSGSDRRFRAGPKGYTRSDDRLKEDICERLMMADSVDSTEVSVNVKEGQVTLEGSVPNRRMKHTIEDLVDAAPGVQDIDNRLRVERGESRYGSSGSGTGTTSGTSSTTGAGTGATTQRTYSQGTSASGTTQGVTGSGISGSGTTTQGASGSSTSSGLGSGQRRKE